MIFCVLCCVAAVAVLVVGLGFGYYLMFLCLDFAYLGGCFG